ncbi:MAG: putative tryptophan/tyrosine transport system substrate-binding protein [Candidatus Dependentiae bacterium]|nr:putative tryptophan/tyrosine transport system substrate-binding protein [Candidatus Dependentiae bacterium]
MRKNKRIAILTRARFSYHRQLGWGFLEAMDNCSEDISAWTPVMFFCREALRDVMYEQMKEVSEDKYDLIISVGSLWTDVATQFIHETGLKVPLVFGGVTDPIALGILSDLKPTPQITGIYREPASWLLVAKILHRIKPTMKRLLIPYYEHAENGLVAKVLEGIRNYYATVGVETILYPVQKVGSYSEELHELLLTVDTLWSFEGGFLDIFSSYLIEVCNARHITFFSNNGAHVAQGAALVYAAPDFKSMGEALVSQAYGILEEGKTPDQLEIIQLPSDRKLMVSVEAAKMQGLEIDDALLLAIQNELLLL